MDSMFILELCKSSQVHSNSLRNVATSLQGTFFLMKREIVLAKFMLLTHSLGFFNKRGKVFGKIFFFQVFLFLCSFFQ
jgi:hypothetical protein